MVVLTFREHGRFSRELQTIRSPEGTTYYPTPEEIESCCLKNEQYVDECKFVLTLEWLLAKNEEPKTDEERESQKAMRKYTREHLVIVDTKEEKRKWLKTHDEKGEKKN